MLNRLLAIAILIDSSRLALYLSLGTLAVGFVYVGLTLGLSARAYAAVPNAGMRWQTAFSNLPNLQVKVVGCVLALATPQGKTAHSANREGASGILTTLDRIAAAGERRGQSWTHHWLMAQVQRHGGLPTRSSSGSGCRPSGSKCWQVQLTQPAAFAGLRWYPETARTLN